MAYRFLPFHFLRNDRFVLLTTDAGNFHFLNHKDFDLFVQKFIDKTSSVFQDLKAKGFLTDGSLSKALDLEATKYRTKKRHLEDFTSLHMFVLTRRCNQRCVYCHASSLEEDDRAVPDMDAETARKCVDLAFSSPSDTIKIEFQGGEPTLNFPTLKEIVRYANSVNESKGKNLEFVLCTNLNYLSEDQLDFIREYKIDISTSLDGPDKLHDLCRIKSDGSGTHKQFCTNLSRVVEVIGKDRVSCLLTIHKGNLQNLGNVIEEYLRLGLGSIFLRDINPFGFADEKRDLVAYETDDFIEAYNITLDRIIRLNLEGRHFPEMFATLLLTRILTPFSTGFVDLQSPAGAGISGVIYDTSGKVFVSDEARMLFASTGDDFFCLGNAHTDSWVQIFGGEKLREVVGQSCIESLPGCAWCAYQPYCGTDPIKNYKQYGDLISFKPTDDFCRKNKAIFTVLFDYLESAENDVLDVFWSWITGRTLAEIRGIKLPEGCG